LFNHCLTKPEPLFRHCTYPEALLFSEQLSAAFAAERFDLFVDHGDVAPQAGPGVHVFAAHVAYVLGKKLISIYFVALYPYI
jgi:hypothetical protein